MAEKIYEGTRFRGSSWSYRFKLTLPNGKKITKEKCGFKSSYEAYKAKIDEVARCRLTNFVEKKITLNQMYELYLEESATKHKSYNTIKRYNSLYKNHIKDSLGELLVGRIQPLDITHFLNKLEEQYKSDYPNSFYNFFLVLFKFAKTHKYINEDIMECVERPKQYSREEVKLLTPEQFNALEIRLQSTNVQIAFTIAKNTGLRASEVYALRWSDFDFEKNTLRVDKQLQKRKGIWCFAPTKTSKSVRTVYFGEDFSQYMQFVKELQEQNRKRLKEFYKCNKIIDCLGRTEETVIVEDFVNVKENGDMLSPDSNKVISRIAKEMGLEFNFHMLRHYYISALHQNGVDITVIRDCVGHSGLRTIMETYSHTNEEQRARAGAVVDNLMGVKNLMPKADTE